MRYNVAIVGGGTAGCVLAARLTEGTSRQVCLIEAEREPGGEDLAAYVSRTMRNYFHPAAAGSVAWWTPGAASFGSPGSSSQTPRCCRRSRARTRISRRPRSPSAWRRRSEP